MGLAEIVLFVVGAIIIVVSFIIPEKYGSRKGESKSQYEQKIRDFLNNELQRIRTGIEEKIDEGMVSSSDKAERFMERMTNEKIMAIQEYSDTVLEQIHKNHEEAVFLYDMLNNKHDQIKYTSTQINSSVEEAKERLDGIVKNSVNELLKEGFREEAVEKSLFSKTGEETVPVLSTEAAGEDRPENKVELFRMQRESGKTEEDRAQEEGTVSRSTDGEDRIAESLSLQEVDHQAGMKETILCMHREGKKDTDIARELNLGVGEVRLIIGLYD